MNVTMCSECGNALHDHCFDCSYRPIQGLELSLDELCVVGEMAYKKDLTPAQLIKQAIRFYQTADILREENAALTARTVEAESSLADSQRREGVLRDAVTHLVAMDDAFESALLIEGPREQVKAVDEAIANSRAAFDKCKAALAAGSDGGRV